MSESITNSYIIESQHEGAWRRAGTTKDPDEWERLMRQAIDVNGRAYRVRAGKKIVLNVTLRDSCAARPATPAANEGVY